MIPSILEMGPGHSRGVACAGHLEPFRGIRHFRWTEISVLRSQKVEKSKIQEDFRISENMNWWGNCCTKHCLFFDVCCSNMKKILYQVYQVKTSSKHFPLERASSGRSLQLQQVGAKVFSLQFWWFWWVSRWKKPTRSMGGLRDRNIKPEQVQKLIDIGRDQCAETALQAALWLWAPQASFEQEFCTCGHWFKSVACMGSAVGDVNRCHIKLHLTCQGHDHELNPYSNQAVRWTCPVAAWIAFPRTTAESLWFWCFMAPLQLIKCPMVLICVINLCLDSPR